MGASLSGLAIGPIAIFLVIATFAACGGYLGIASRLDVVVLRECGHNTLLFHRESIARVVDRVRTVQEVARRAKTTSA